MRSHDFANIRHGLMAATLGLIGIALAPRAAAAQVGVTTFRACYVPGSGTVYRIGASGMPSSCKSSSHVEFQWTDFARAVDPTIVFNSVSIDAGDTVIGEAQCPANTLMYTGGYALHSDKLRILASAPDPSPSAIGLRTWVVQVTNDGSSTTSFGVYARCMKL
jgi:hypothetical protein